MGLDLMLHPHAPKPGREHDYNRIKNKLERLHLDESLTKEQRAMLKRDLEKQLETVAVSPYEVIQAPRIGVDPDATEWFRRNCYEPAQRSVEHERQVPVGDGVQVTSRSPTRSESFIRFWSRPFEAVLADEHGKYVVQLAKDKRGVAAITGIACGALDFRGKVIGSAECLPEDLRNEAFDEHDAEQSLDFAVRLEAALHEVDDDHLDEVVDIRHGIAWMKFWGERGFGWSPWY